MEQQDTTTPIPPAPHRLLAAAALAEQDERRQKAQAETLAAVDSAAERSKQLQTLRDEQSVLLARYETIRRELTTLLGELLINHEALQGMRAAQAVPSTVLAINVPKIDSAPTPYTTAQQLVATRTAANLRARRG